MSNPERTLALMHKRDKPDEPRSLDQLEAHYRSLAMGSLFAPVVLAMKRAEERNGAVFAAQAVVNRARRA